MQQLQKPKQGYKIIQTPYGGFYEIPDDWDMKKLEHLVKFSSGEFLPENNQVNGNIPVYGGNGIMGWHNESIMDKSTIVIGRVGAYCGSVHLTPEKSWVTDNAIFIKQLSDEINLEYLFRYMNRLDINSLAEVAAQPKISQGILNHINIKFPKNIQEQQKIASILSNLDSLIQQTQKEIEQTQRLKKGLMQRLLTKGIGHTKFKKEELGRKFLRYEIPQHWNISKINDFATVHGRIGWKNLRADEYADNGPLMLSVWSLVETVPYGVDYKEGVNRLSKFRYEESPEIKLQDNDVLVAKDGDIGRIGFVKKLPEPASLNSHVVVVRVFEKSVNSEFLYWYMKTKPFQTYCIAFTSGTTVPLLTQKDLKDTKIPIPPLSEQEKISFLLSTHASKIYSLQQKKSKLETLKKGLMQKLLTGQIRVKV